MNSVSISGYIRRIGQVREVSGDNKVVDIVISIKKATVRDNKPKYDNIKCTCWRGQAEYVSRFAKEGEFAVVQGQLANRNYEDKDGKMIYETYIVVSDLQIPKLTDTTSNEQVEKAVKEDGYVDVGKVSARQINNIYRQDEDDESLPF